MALASILQRLMLMVKRPKRKFTIQLPCTYAQVRAYHGLLKSMFRNPELIPTQRGLIRARRINPYSLIIISDTKRKVLGGIELYGFKKRFFDAYIKGTKTDKDFGELDFLGRPNFASIGQVVKQRRLYCAITVEIIKYFDGSHPRLDREGNREVRDHLLRATVETIEKVYLERLKTESHLLIYAIGANELGRALLKNAGFESISDGKERKDEKPLYCLTLSRGALKQFLKLLLENSPADPDDLAIKFRRTRS